MLTKEERAEIRREVEREVDWESYDATALLPLLDALDEMERERDAALGSESRAVTDCDSYQRAMNARAAERDAALVELAKAQETIARLTKVHP